MKIITDKSPFGTIEVQFLSHGKVEIYLKKKILCRALPLKRKVFWCTENQEIQKYLMDMLELIHINGMKL